MLVFILASGRNLHYVLSLLASPVNIQWLETWMQLSQVTWPRFKTVFDSQKSFTYAMLPLLRMNRLPFLIDLARIVQPQTPTPYMGLYGTLKLSFALKVNILVCCQGKRLKCKNYAGCIFIKYNIS